MSDSVVQANRTEPQPFVRIRNATMKFAGVTALHALDWDILPGEVHCLIGENGCGKSTTIKILSGVHRRSARVLVTPEAVFSDLAVRVAPSRYPGLIDLMTKAAARAGQLPGLR